VFHCRASPAGLDIEKDTIIEIACLVTDGELRQIVEVRSSQPQQCAVGYVGLPARWIALQSNTTSYAVVQQIDWQLHMNQVQSRMLPSAHDGVWLAA
jgi:oligoribonuclease (3'-5' exoribonuclease)